MTKAVIIKIYGRVQGVGFRYYSHKKAIELNICGFVQNKPDGSVYIEAEGDQTKLSTFIDWLNIGTKWAKVTKVETQFMPPLFVDDFIIK